MKIGNINQEELIEAIKNKDEVLISDIESQYIDVVTDKFKEIFHRTDEDFKLKLHISTGTNEIYFLTNDKTSKNHSINISERSDGFRWYLSIYLTLYDYLDEKVHSDNHILLIDEPNLYLHAGMQRDLLYRIFKTEFQDMQIIYSTHSPYMIDADNTFSIRIIEKDDQTHIYNSSREYSIQNQSLKDIDAITPLLTSLELNISNTLIFDEKCKVFVVEGIQDVMKKLNNKNALNRNWRTTNIDRMLSNYIYCGDYLYGKRAKNTGPIHLEDVCPAIIDKETFRMVQTQKERNLKNYTRKHTYVYMQKIVCSKCNKIMGGSSSTSKNKPTQIYYKYNCCNNRFNEKKIEKPLMLFLNDMLDYYLLIDNNFKSFFNENLSIEIDKYITSLSKPYNISTITIEKDKLNLDEFENNNNLLQIIPNKKNHKFDKDKYALLLING